MGRLKWWFTGMLLAAALFESSAQLTIGNFSQKFEIYNSVLPRTRLHLILNQPKFSPGDTIWFKTYFLAEDLLGVAGKQLINVNLVNANGEAVVHFKFNVFNGVGHNQLVIPESLPPGIYMLTAHSSWMKNFDPAFIFQKEVEIVESNTIARKSHPAFEVFPEGGRLVGDVPNRMIINAGEEGVPVEIVDEEGKVIENVLSGKRGYSSIVFTPHKNVVYFVKKSGANAKLQLPAAEDDGFSMRVTVGETNTEPVKLILAAPPASPLRKQLHTVVLAARGKIYYHQPVHQTTDAAIQIEVPQDNLPQGIIHLALFSNEGELLGNRDFYSPGSGRQAVNVQLVTSKNIYQPREKVEVSVALTHDASQPVEGEFSVGVTSADLFNGEEMNLLQDELNIFSATKGRFQIDRSDNNWHQHLDDYLITVTDESRWKDILTNEVRKPPFGFTSRVKLVGRAYDAATSEPLPDFTQIMFYLQRDKRRYQTFTTQGGLFGLEILDVFGEDELFYMAQSNGVIIPDFKIEWAQDTITLPHAPETKTTTIADEYGSFAVKTRFINLSYGFFTAPAAISPEPEARGRDFDRIIKEADNVFEVADYVPFPSMEELIKEVIGPLFIRRREERSIVRVKFLQDLEATGEPLYVIDGIATSNTAFFLSLNPVDVLTIKIVSDPRKLALFGFMGKNGIVIVETRSGDKREPVDNTRLISGLNKPLSFTASAHGGGGNPRVPDFRSTVYWNPFIKIDAGGRANIEFYCPDNLGKFRIRIEGLTADGKPFTAVREITVQAAETE